MRTIVRYPGGKSRKAKEIISYFSKINYGLVEPMCGGCGVSLAYASLNSEANIILSDINPIVGAFWECIVNTPKKFFDLLEPMTLEVYKRYSHLNPQSTAEKAMKFFVLNKCSFNGYIFEGSVPVGGWDQSGKWKVDWCWNVEKIKQDVLKVNHLLKERTQVYTQSIFDIIKKYGANTKLNWYIDPPYFKEGKKMYFPYGEFEHEKLAEYIKNYIQGNVIISYDYDERLTKYYSDFQFSEISVHSSRKLINVNKKLHLTKQTEYLIYRV